jgi:alkanesulfonate monooxygenase SsuD/methylene tetrahydromethanopterin reductase-like flavin-dependent oxidoreductase (luciferase family)
MRYAIDVAPLGELADPAAIVRLAVAAERAGWDGLSTWDVLGTVIGAEAADPFVALAAVAAATDRLRLITSVVVLPRRRPQLVAQAAATLDRLSGGRLVLGVGAGGDPGDFTLFGESFEAAPRLAHFDEAATLIDGYLRRIDGPPVGPRSVQRPRPPMWMGGMRPGALRRAARMDGWIAVATNEDGSAMTLTAPAFAALVARLGDERAAIERAGEPFDIAVFGRSAPSEAALVSAFGTAGATWWLESLAPLRGPMDELLARVEAGPPAG